MDLKVKQKWLNNLRSGDFKQGYKGMCKHNGYVGEDNYVVWYDPLGVLIETVLGEDIWSDSKDDYDTLEPKWQNGSLFPSKKFLREVRLDEAAAIYIASFNDEGALFTEIADWIEENVF